MQPKKFGDCHHHASRIRQQRRFQCSHVHAARSLVVAKLRNRDALVLRARRQHFAVLRMHRTSHRAAQPSGHAAGHQHCFRTTGRPVIHAGVRDLHARQLADHRLELKRSLQRALRDLRLVRRVTRQELATLHQRVDDHRPVVPVRTRTQEAGEQLACRCFGKLRHVAARQVGRIRTETIQHLALRMLTRNLEVAGQPVLFRNTGKQIINRADANGVQHFRAVGWGLRKINALSSGLASTLASALARASARDK